MRTAFTISIFLLAIAANAANANAATEPSGVVRLFFQASAQGAPLDPYWAAQTAARDPFERAAERLSRSRCSELDGVRIDDVAVQQDDAVVRATILVTKRERATGVSWGPVPIVYELKLHREPDGWRIVDLSQAAEKFAAAYIAAPDTAARRALLAGSPDQLSAGLGRVLHQKAIAASNVPNLPEAERISALAEEIAVETGDSAGSSLHLSMTSILARSRGRFLEARAIARDALAIAHDRGEPDVIARALISLARTYDQDPIGNDGPGFFQEAIALEPRVEDLSLIVRAVRGRQLEFERSDDHVNVRRLIDESLRLARLAGDEPGIAIAYSSLAHLHDALGDPLSCIDYSRQAAELYQKHSADELYISSMFREARCRYEAGDTAAGKALMNRSIEIARDRKNECSEAISLSELAGMSASEGKYEEAECLSRAAIAKCRQLWRVGGTAVLTLAATLLELKRYAEVLDATSAYRAEVIRASSAPSSELSVSIYDSKAHRGLGDRAAALDDLENAIGALERLRANAVGDEQQRVAAVMRFPAAVLVYTEAVDLNVELGRIETALAYAERDKGRVLLDALRGGHRSTKSMSEEDRQTELRIESEIASTHRALARTRGETPEAAALRERLDRARVALATFNTRLDTRYPRLKAQRGEIAMASLRQMADALPDRGAFVEYVIGDERSHVFVVTRTPDGHASLEARVLAIDRDALNAKVAAFRKQLTGYSPGYRKAARELDALLVEPVDDLLRSVQTVGIVPDGALWQLPFEALVDAKGKYRIERQTIFYAPSISVLLEMRKKTPKPGPRTARTVLAMADPVIADVRRRNLAAIYRSTDLSPLPDARREVERLRAIYGSGAVVYVGAEATEARMKAELAGFDMLHFATHGILDDTSPMYSRLVLAETDAATGTDSDGLLEAWELMKLDIDADLVVMSSCDSASGRVSAGEGMIGMTWAAFVAGANTTVASLWKVASKSTAVLMADFHRELQAQSSGTVMKAEALRRAKLLMLRDPAYEHPFYWAPFVVIGDPGSARK